MNILYKLVLIASIAAMVVIYGVMFNRLSEDALVKLSYVWMPPLVFGITGLKWGKSSWRTPLVCAAAAVVLLFIFFEGVWPAL